MDILDLLQDKSGVIEFLINTMDANEKSNKGLRKIKEGNSSEEHKINILLEVVANQSTQIKTLSLLLLCYAKGQNFDTDIAMIMNQMGRGKEAAQQLWKNKFK